MKNRDVVMNALHELRWELEQLAARIDRIAAIIEEPTDIGSRYREQIRAPQVAAEEPDPEAEGT